MACVVAPVLHAYEEAVVAVNTTLPPVQKVVEPEVAIFATDGLLTVTVVGVEIAEHPFALKTVTV
jgi:hypothetical protein